MSLKFTFFVVRIFGFWVKGHLMPHLWVGGGGRGQGGCILVSYNKDFPVASFASSVETPLLVLSQHLIIIMT